MKSFITVGVLLIGCLAGISARAAGRLAEVALIDRDTGERLEAHYHHGEYWVAGEPGARYAIEIHNDLGERLLAVMSVDGVNVITGQDAGWDQAGYVLDPWASDSITGWRKSDYQVASFVFIAAPRSYAARTGRPENVGVIGIALFREQVSYAALPERAPRVANEGAAVPPRFPPAPASSERKSESSAPARRESRSSDLSSNTMASQPPPQAPTLGTAHGSREYSYVAHTRFVRRQWRPDELIRIRYDSFDNLVALGIVRPHPQSVLHPLAFPGTSDRAYVPDPPPFRGASPY